MTNFDPLPRNALTLVDASRMKLMHLMALALYERGAPMSSEDIRDRLLAIGIDRSIGAMQKSWHGRPLFRKSRDGRFNLVEDDPDWKGVETVTILHLRELQSAVEAPAPRTPPPRPVEDEATPLTLAEARDVLRDGPFTLRRLLIALIEAMGRPISVDEAIAEIAPRVGSRATRVDIERSLRGLPGALHRDSDGRLAVDPAHPDLPKLRRLVRAHVREAVGRRKRSEETAHNIAAWEGREATERSERRKWYAGASKLLVRTVFDGERLVAAAGFDPDARRFETFSDPAELAARLARTEIILGLDPWSDLEQLGVTTAGRTLVDLSPPNRTRTINRSGRTLKITPELLIAGTLGIAHPLGDPAAVRDSLASGARGKIHRRLEADLKSLWRFYEYGCQHACVRLRWGYLDEIVPVHWNVGRQPMVHEILEEAGETGRLVEVVLGAAPGWKDPWARAGLCRVLAMGLHVARLESAEGVFDMGTEEIAAIRIVGGS